MRGGGIGVVDLEFAATCAGPAAGLAERIFWLCNHARLGDRIGVRLAPQHVTDYADCLSELAGRGGVVVLTEPPCATALATARELSGLRVLVEVRSLSDYLKLADGEAVPDGVIACGNETGGFVGDDTTFILLQKLLQRSAIPVYARGGIGLNAVAGCRAAGARGVVLDDQILLTPESPLPDDWKRHLDGPAGHETAVIGHETGRPCRVLDRPVFDGVTKLKAVALSLAARPATSPEDEWGEAVATYVAWNAPDAAAWPVGQGIGLAVTLQRRFHGTEGIVKAFIRESSVGISLAQEYHPFAKGSPLARSHGTDYPVVQGPMTRVSDRPEFALAVAEGGALPLIALSMLSGWQMRPILEATRDCLGERPWGVGILGFVPSALREEQIAEVRRVRPPFAIIAGGRPDLASDLESDGIATYLHVPVPALLRSFLAQGAKRFIFEGRECGGHVGPLCSFPLWEAMIEVLLDAVAPADAPSIHVLFAGGIHDAVSVTILSAMAAPLAERGICCGLLMGTAYLFTREAVETGAVVEHYQREAVACESTVLLTSGVGHSNRVAYTSFADEFERERLALLKSHTPPDKVQAKLESIMLGRLRLASKGLTRDAQGDLIPVEVDEQAASGMYMLGQVATLRASVERIADLHLDVCKRSAEAIDAAARSHVSQPHAGYAEGVAIIGMAGILPGAATHAQFWRNILDHTGSIREVPTDRFNILSSYDPEKSTRDKSYSKWGGFIDDVAFDPIRYRIPPTVMPSISTTQMLALEATQRALADAGYADGNFDRANTAVVLGTNGGGSFLNEQLVARAMLPHLFGEVDESVLSAMPEWTGETLPGVLANVAAGRIANQFDLGGPNYAVDAACASSIVALDLAVRELESGRSNMAISGGVDTAQTPFSYVAFSKTQALSPTGRIQVFDKSADGTVISEGVCILVLKRLSDALRHHDRIYAVIRGTGGSSDGKGLGLTAPKVEGQRRAVERALRRAGISADTLGLYEAHGTGTQLGDRTELETLMQLLRESGGAPYSCNVGSVKALIGHTKMAAGAVGVAKAALALYHRVLPPHGAVGQPVDPLTEAETPLYILDRPKPWLVDARHPRRAGVSAFGFGGTNGHVVLEESDERHGAAVGADLWPCELFLFCGRTVDELLARVTAVADALAHGSKPSLAGLALALAREAEQAQSGPRMAVVAANLKELAEALSAFEKKMRNAAMAGPSPQIMFAPSGKSDANCVAFLFPGQGSQYLNMGLEPTLYNEDVRAAFEFSNEALANDGKDLTDYVFVPAATSQAEQDRLKQALNRTDHAQPAIGALSVGFLDLLDRLGVVADMFGGHSYGELTALHAAGMLSRQTFFRLSQIRGQAMNQCCANGGMVSVAASREQAAAFAKDVPGVVVANHNGPSQTVLSGPLEGLKTVQAKCSAEGIRAISLPVAGAFHSPLMASAMEPWSAALEQAAWRSPRCPVYGNSDGTPYDGDAEATRRRLREHVLNPVEFTTQIARMHEDGARIFVEVGPGKVLTRLVSSILKDLPHQCIAMDSRQGQLSGFLQGIGELAVCGAVPWPSQLFQGRGLVATPLDRLLEDSKLTATPATEWRVNGTYARPASGAVPEHSPSFSKVPREAASIGQPVARPVASQAYGSDQADILSAYSAYQETMRRFLALEEQALSGFMALAHSSGGGLAHRVEAGIKSFDPWLGRSMPSPHLAPDKAKLPNAVPQPEPEAEPKPVSDEASHATALENLQDIVLRVLGKQTGYPIETLGLDLDLAGDLGIDSLRKVEFFTALAETLPTAEQAIITGAMEEIMATSTIRALLARLRNLLEKPPAAATTPPLFAAGGSDALAGLPAANSEHSIDPPANVRNGCPRFLPTEYSLPVDKSHGSALRGTVLLTEDGEGVAQRIAEKLDQLGVASILLGRETLENPEALRHCLSDGADNLCAIVHLAPVAREAMPSQFEAWHRLVQIQAKSLFQILHSGGQKLRRRQDVAPLQIVAASLMGGRFGRDGSFGPGLPIGGAAAGMLKSRALEGPGTVVKAIDFDGSQGAMQMADWLIDELLHGDGHHEIGYPGGVRTVFTHRAAPHLRDGSQNIATPMADWVVLATGGARGITADVLRSLAQPGMTVILSGRSASPLAEPDELAKLGDAAALRDHFLEEAGRCGETVTPVRVNERVQKVMQGREMRDTLAQLEASGVNVAYRPCDMRSPDGVFSLLSWIYATYGRMDALIHGAGIIEDKLLVDKDWDSFDRVFDTKVDSTYLLGHFIRPVTLKLAVFFGSVSGRAGSPGQTDYAAANEVLNRFAWWLRQRWTKARVVTINWGPWATSGMATPLVQAQLKKRGILPIEVEAGCAFFADEIALGATGDVEVLAGAGPWAEPPSASEGKLAHDASFTTANLISVLGRKP